MSERSEYLRDRSTELLAGAREVRPSEFVAGGAWSLRFGGPRPAKVVSVVSGACWLHTEHSGPVLLRAGESYLLAGGGSYVTTSDPALEPGDGAASYVGSVAGVARYQGPDGPEMTRMVGGNLLFPHAGLLPPGARLGQDVLATLNLLAAEAASPGRLSWHLSQVLYLQVLRGVRIPAWDARISAALAAFHRRPGSAWTVATLAAAAGLSRTVFATRFKTQVGLAPMEYVLRHRIAGAERELAAGRTVASVAARWGYASESAFSAAFKRVTGRRPAAPPPGWRPTAGPPGPAGPSRH